MKKSEFLEKVATHRLNTVFTEYGQIERAIDIFEDLGMLPPYSDHEGLYNEALADGYTWEPEGE